MTRGSDALDLEPGVFTRGPKEMARSLRRSAQKSRRRKASAFQSAMSMLTFYENRAGRRLAPARRRVLDQAKDELRRLYDRPPRAARGGATMPKYGKKASEEVGKAMHERKRGTLKSGGSGKTVKSRKQAVAIGLSKARKKGAKVPSKASASRSGTTRRRKSA